jgi:hypothetical protein
LGYTRVRIFPKESRIRRHCIPEAGVVNCGEGWIRIAVKPGHENHVILVVVCVLQHGVLDRLEVAQALDAGRRRSGFIQRRQEHRDQQGDDSDDNQQFDQRKRFAFPLAHCGQFNESKSIAFPHGPTSTLSPISETEICWSLMLLTSIIILLASGASQIAAAFARCSLKSDNGWRRHCSTKIALAFHPVKLLKLFFTHLMLFNS